MPWPSAQIGLTALTRQRRRSSGEGTVSEPADGILMNQLSLPCPWLAPETSRPRTHATECGPFMIWEYVIKPTVAKVIDAVNEGVSD